MQAVALAVVVTDRSHNPLWTGAVAAAAFIPIGVLSPVGGALADRLDRRRWLITTTVAEAGFAAVLAVLAATGHAPSWALLVVAFFGGVAAAVGFPTYQAMIPDLVPPEDLLGAVSLSSAQYNVGRVIGPALAGVVLLAGSPAWVFAAERRVVRRRGGGARHRRAPRHEARCRRRAARSWRRIAEGARIAAAEPGCRSAIVLIGIVAFIGSPFIALVPAVAITALAQGAGGTSVLLTAQGIGAVSGSLVLASLVLALGRRLLVGALFAFPVAVVGYGLAPSLWWAAAALLVVGGCYIGVLTGLNTVVQRRAPPEARGRVLGLYMMVLGRHLSRRRGGAGCHRARRRAFATSRWCPGVLFAVMVAVRLTAAPLHRARGPWRHRPPRSRRRPGGRPDRARRSHRTGHP